MKFLNSKIFTTVIAIALALFSISLFNVNSERLAYKEEIDVLEGKIEVATKEKEYLKKTVSFLTDKSFLERQARIKFNFKYAGEEVAFIYPSEANISSFTEDSRSALPNHLKWWYYLFDIK